MKEKIGEKEGFEVHAKGDITQLGFRIGSYVIKECMPVSVHECVCSCVCFVYVLRCVCVFFVCVCVCVCFTT